MATEKDQPVKKKGAGRPKGSKNSLPFTTFPEAISYTQMIWEKAKDGEISFKEICSGIGLHEKKAVRVLNSLKDFYGVVEKKDRSWCLTDAGKRLARNEAMALRDVFTKDPMFADLYARFGERSVTEGVILDYIQKKYKFIDAEETKQRLLAGITRISGGSAQKISSSAEPAMDKDFALPLFKLRYALKPATKEELDGLVTSVIKRLEASGDETLKLLSELMHEKRKNSEDLVNLLDKAMRRLKADDINESEDSNKNNVQA